MSSERDINSLIAERRRRYLAGERPEDAPEDDEEDETSVIVLTDYYGFDDVVSEFFRSFYTGEVSVNADTYRVTLKLACQYQVSWVISVCCQFLERFLAEDNFIDHFKFLMALKEDRVTEATIRKLQSCDYCKLINHGSIAPEWLNIDIDLLVVLLDNLQAPLEIYIAHLAFSWLEHNLEHRKKMFETIISNLRLFNLPQSFIDNVILKFSDVHKVDSTNLYRMVLGTQSYFFSLQMGGTPRKKTLESFPKVYESRASYLKMEEFEFRISIPGLAEGDFVTDNVRLVYNEETGRYRFVFSRSCCFVYITNEQLVALYPISKILIPVDKSIDQYNTTGEYFVSKEIDVIKDVLLMSDNDRDANFVSFVAVFFSEDDSN